MPVGNACKEKPESGPTVAAATGSLLRKGGAPKVVSAVIIGTGGNPVFGGLEWIP